MKSMEELKAEKQIIFGNANGAKVVLGLRGAAEAIGKVKLTPDEDMAVCASLIAASIQTTIEMDRISKYDAIQKYLKAIIHMLDAHDVILEDQTGTQH